MEIENSQLLKKLESLTTSLNDLEEERIRLDNENTSLQKQLSRGNNCNKQQEIQLKQNAILNNTTSSDIEKGQNTVDVYDWDDKKDGSGTHSMLVQIWTILR
jgi:septal ring factor EnvC (AmiA/AmiB activator)